MARKRRVAAHVAIGFAAALLVLVAAILFLTRTPPGVQKVGGYVVRSLGDRISGKLTVRRVSSRGGLLGGVTLHGVELQAPGGRPFLSADSVRLSYNWRSLLAGRIVFDRIGLFRPRLVLEKLPGDTAWNFSEALATPPSARPSTPSSSAPLILIGGIRVRDGDVVVRTAIAPDSGRAIQPADTARLIVRRLPGGLVREMRFERLDASLPRVLVSSPQEEGRLVEVASLSTRGYVWQTPFDLRALRGTLVLHDSLVAFDLDRVELPDSRAAALGRVVVTSPHNRVDVQIDGQRLRLEDLQWLYPGLPPTGTGRLQLRMQTRPDGGTLFYARDIDITAPQTHVTGQLGIVVGDDSTYLTRVDLRANPLNLEILQQLIPGDVPLEGLRVGTLEVRGTP